MVEKFMHVMHYQGHKMYHTSSKNFSYSIPFTIRESPYTKLG